MSSDAATLRRGRRGHAAQCPARPRFSAAASAAATTATTAAAAVAADAAVDRQFDDQKLIN